jgi:hypothetical protein
VNDDALTDSPGPAPVSAPVSASAEEAGKEKDIFGRVPRDRPDWSHRRGEPRVFALVWMLYLMGVTALMFASLSDAFFVSPAITRPAARGMLLATMAGLVLMWPAVRLSQRPADRPVRSVLRDLFVVLIPAQAVIWPHALRELGDWSFGVLTALAGVFAAWALVVGGILAMADSGVGAGRARWAWMLVLLVLCLGAPAYAVSRGQFRMVPGPASSARPGWMLSPLTAVLEVTRDRDAADGVTAVSGTHWRLIAAPACVGGSLLCLAGAGGVAARRGRA